MFSDIYGQRRPTSDYGDLCYKPTNSIATTEYTEEQLMSWERTDTMVEQGLCCPHTAQRPHNIEPTSIKRWSTSLNQRWIDIVSMLCACWEGNFLLLWLKCVLFRSSSAHNGLCIYSNQDRSRPTNIPNQHGRLDLNICFMFFASISIKRRVFGGLYGYCTYVVVRN